jgi:hypothetical protein
MIIFMAGITIMAGAVATRSIGYGWWYTILACTQLVLMIWSLVRILHERRTAGHNGLQVEQ